MLVGLRQMTERLYDKHEPLPLQATTMSLPVMLIDSCGTFFTSCCCTGSDFSVFNRHTYSVVGELSLFTSVLLQGAPAELGRFSHSASLSDWATLECTHKAPLGEVADVVVVVVVKTLVIDALAEVVNVFLVPGSWLNWASRSSAIDVAMSWWENNAERSESLTPPSSPCGSLANTLSEIAGISWEPTAWPDSGESAAPPADTGGCSARP